MSVAANSTSMVVVPMRRTRAAVVEAMANKGRVRGRATAGTVMDVDMEVAGDVAAVVAGAWGTATIMASAAASNARCLTARLSADSLCCLRLFPGCFTGGRRLQADAGNYHCD